jgi:hypothetical protein
MAHPPVVAMVPKQTPGLIKFLFVAGISCCELPLAVFIEKDGFFEAVIVKFLQLVDRKKIQLNNTFLLDGFNETYSWAIVLTTLDIYIYIYTCLWE